MKSILPLILLLACGSEPAAETSATPDPDAEKIAQMAASLASAYPCSDPVQAPGDILVIGDSISVGYYPHIAAALPAQRVVHNQCNAMNSSFTVTNIDSWLAASPRWDVVTFNNGMWDIARFALVSPELYGRNLAKIADKILARADKVIYVLTTAVPENAKHRTDARARELNEVARRVMAERGIEIVDLHAVSSAMPHLYENSESKSNVHFTDAGSRALAEAIVAAIKD